MTDQANKGPRNAADTAPQLSRRPGIAAVWCGALLGVVLAAAFLCHGGATAPAEAAATAHHILASGTLYRAGFVIDVVALACLL